MKITWKTVSIAIEKESKFEAGVPKSKLKVPPNSCIPNNAKIRMKRKSSNRRDTIDLSEANKDTTRFLNDDQYLKKSFINQKTLGYNISTHVVTLNILSSLKALRTESPKDPAFGLK